MQVQDIPKGFGCQVICPYKGRTMPEKQDTWVPIGKLAEELARKLAEKRAEK